MFPDLTTAGAPASAPPREGALAGGALRLPAATPRAAPADSEFLGFQKDRGAAWLLRPGARGGCRLCSFLSNSAEIAGPAMYLSAGADTEDPAMAWASGGLANRNSAPNGNFAWAVTNQRSTLFSQPRMQVRAAARARGAHVHSWSRLWEN